MGIGERLLPRDEWETAYESFSDKQLGEEYALLIKEEQSMEGKLRSAFGNEIAERMLSLNDQIATFGLVKGMTAEGEIAKLLGSRQFPEGVTPETLRQVNWRLLKLADAMQKRGIEVPIQSKAQ